MNKSLKKIKSKYIHYYIILYVIIKNTPGLFFLWGLIKKFDLHRKQFK